MAMKDTNNESTNPLFLIEFAKGVFAGNPTALRVTEQMKASLWADEGLALAKARELGGQVVAWTPPTGAAAALHVLARRPKAGAPMAPRPALTLVPTVAPAVIRRPRSGAKAEPPAPAPAPAPTKPVRAPKAPKGPAREEVVALLAATGLRLEEKSSSHYGDPKGPRLVLPRSASVTRVFLYKMPDAADLLGHKTPDERKELGLGAVTHVADVTSLDQVRPLIEAVCVANGLKAPKAAPAKAKRSRKSAGGEASGDTPPGGTPTAIPTEPQVTSSEAGTGGVEGTTTGESGPTQTSEGAS
jgi:hypothetical protein